MGHLFAFPRSAGLVGLCILLAAAWGPAAAAGTEPPGDPGWSVLETERMRVWIADPARIHPAALDSLDAFVPWAMDALQLTAAQRAEVTATKVDYFLCADARQVERMSGANLEGLALLQHNAVITRWLFHAHEIVHLLHARTFQSPQVLQEPVLLEGLACALGGRSRESAAVVAVRGDDLLDAGLVDPTQLLGYYSFHVGVGDPEMSFPVAARLVAFLLESGRDGRFQDLARGLAGSADEVIPRRREEVVRRVEQVYGMSFDELMVRFHAWRRRQPPPALETAEVPARAAQATVASSGRIAQAWWEDDGGLIVRLRGGEGAANALVHWGPPLPRGYRPWLVAVGTPARRHALRLGPDRIEFLDLALDRIVGIPRGSLTGSAPGFFDPTANAITVRIPAELLARSPRPASLEIETGPSFEVLR